MRESKACVLRTVEVRALIPIIFAEADLLGYSFFALFTVATVFKFWRTRIVGVTTKQRREIGGKMSEYTRSTVTQ